MPLIQPEVEVEQKSVSMPLEKPVFELLEKYCKFVRKSKGFVVSRMLEMDFARDKDFQKHLLEKKSQAKPEVLPVAAKVATGGANG